MSVYRNRVYTCKCALDVVILIDLRTKFQSSYSYKMTSPQDERDKKRWGFLPNKLRIKMSAYTETNMHL